MNPILFYSREPFLGNPIHHIFSNPSRRILCIDRCRNERNPL
ncbi:hypothetical protein MITSMUL_04546 [Mitsuokella multacida DSM 20544]|uniref:Uncharacterized protein n=1 Tax=Mitsuokella multacida DSM 20544 TaxID=500635 RepID=C9KN59_9FIRM|nr:hypothetical protein MITSMUL_04546 [Mitsuokella multacida DSM 20544]